MDWVRLWKDMPTDPKWRVIARRSGRPLPEVLAVFVFMMTNAGDNNDERGKLSGWDDEDVGAALDIDGEHVAAIREAMQGKTLDGDKLSGWDKRQPKREDDSVERVKKWRDNKNKELHCANAPKRDVTQCNATERDVTQCNAPDTDTDKNIDITLVPADGGDAIVSSFEKAKRVRSEKDTELIQAVISDWNDLAADLRLPQVSHITPKRQSAILARSRDLLEYYDFPDAKTGFAGLFAKIRGSPFLRGETGRFRADLDFVITQSSFTKIMENRYAGDETAKRGVNGWR